MKEVNRVQIQQLSNFSENYLTIPRKFICKVNAMEFFADISVVVSKYSSEKSYCNVISAGLNLT